jgi:hypothetical protein
MEKQTFIALLVLTCITAVQVVATMCVGNFGFMALCFGVFIVLFRATDKAYNEWRGK